MSPADDESRRGGRAGKAAVVGDEVDLSAVGQGAGAGEIHGGRAAAGGDAAGVEDGLTRRADVQIHRRRARAEGHARSRHIRHHAVRAGAEDARRVQDQAAIESQ